MNKKIYMILGGILLLIVITLGLILFMSKKNNTVAVTPTNTTTNQGSGTGTGTDTGNGTGNNTGSGTGSNSGSGAGTSTGTGTGTGSSGSSTIPSALIKITDDQVVSPVLSFQNSEVWYFVTSGDLYKENLATGLKQKYLLPQNLTVDAVIWAMQGNDFIVVTNSANGKIFNYYNATSQKFTTYPTSIKEAQFMPSGTQVVYEWTDTTGSQLSIASPDLSNHKKITDLPDADDVLVVSPIGNKIFAYRNNTPSDGKFYYISLDTMKTVTIPTAVSNQVLWSNDGERFILNKLDPKDPTNSQLWLGDIITGPSQDIPLGINTPVSKIVFDSNGTNMYFAIPASDGTGDTFWSYNIKAGTKKELFGGSSTMKIDSSNLLINNDASKLFFRNSDGYLYSITLH